MRCIFSSYHQAWQIPFIISLPTRKRIHGETALLILLQRWNYPCKLVRLMHIFGIHYSTLSLAITAPCSYIHSFTHGQSCILCYTFSTLSSIYLDIANGNEVPFGLEDVVCFVDATMNYINRPGGGIQQQTVYSGKSKRHCIKSQGN